LQMKEIWADLERSFLATNRLGPDHFNPNIEMVPEDPRHLTL
jgi:hypothetical protein